MLKELKILSVFILFLTISINTFALTIDVRVYSEYKITELAFTTVSGKYIIRGDDKTIPLELFKNNPIEIKLVGDKIQIIKNKESLGVFEIITLESVGLMNVFRINTKIDKSPERFYDEDLKLSVLNGNIIIVNRVDLEKYIAGVVQSESGGSSTSIEYFKVQSIIARTYALSNMMKHSREGFNLCDGTHCQVYYRRCNNSDIQTAVLETFNDVIVDKNKKLISAAYHSNSGGQTMNSEHVWKLPTTYLKSVADTFSLNKKNYNWEKIISKKDWLDYFSKNIKNFLNEPYKIQSVLNFEQLKRKQFLIDSIHLKNVRNHFNLKSTFFSVADDGENVILKGKGYGHGVGLSQEGAIRMVELGYKSNEIIKFYYTDVDIIKFTDIVKF